jgi:serine/threonine protein kinase/tetratricopeptide (TPR) repeat protein
VSDDAERLDRLRSALASRYRIVREIGRGGMATVYLAEDIRHDRKVAIKVLKPEVAAALGSQRFLREIQIAAVLTHPHILPLHDSGEADGLVFYVMPYVDGETLRDRLARQKQLPIDEAVAITREVADALAHAHARGVIHRDIKPENILFMGGHAVIADFGVATAVGAAASPRITEGGLALGTPEYMSPEQALGQEDVDARSDIYSLACVTYEMLSGEPPFAGSNFRALLARKLSEPVPRLSPFRETVPPPLEDAVRCALAKIPADRFDTISAFAAALTGVDGATRSPRPRSGHDRWSIPRVSKPAFLVAGLLVVSLVALVVQRQLGDRPFYTSPRASEPRSQPTIAVLPFENLGGADDDYFTAGMTDEITSRLGAVSGLGVIPTRAAQRYERTSMTMRDIGRALGIDYLLVGSVRWADSVARSRSARVTIELVRAADERQIWSKSYDRVIEDIFEVQSDIAAEVADRLGVTLLAAERARLSSRPTSNPEAYQLYLRGRHFWNKRTENNIQLALDHFQQAVDLDPGYSLAWVGIADAWISRGWYSRLAPGDAFPRAKHAALRALEFDSTLAEAHASMAHIHFEFDHDWKAAEREYRRALQLDSTYATAHHWYGGFLSAMGRHEEALEQAESARRLDPLSSIIQTWVGLRYYFAAKNEAAIAEYGKAIELDPGFAPAYWHLGWAYQEMGRFAEAVSAAERALEIEPQSTLYLAAVGHAYARAGRTIEARAILSRLAQASKEKHVSAYHLATIHIALGNADAGLDELQRAHAERSPWIGYMRVDPRLKPVRGYPRFEALIRKAELL